MESPNVGNSRFEIARGAVLPWVARCVSAMAWTLAGARALAMQAALELEASAIWEGESTTLTVSITEPAGRLERPELGAVPGLSIRGPMGPVRQEYVIGGRRSSQLSYTYSVAPQPGKTGTFRIGPARVPVAGGSPLVTGTVELKVYKKPPPGILLRAEVKPRDGPVGSPFRVLYTLCYTGEPYDRDDDFFAIALRGSRPFVLSGLSLPISKLSGVKIRAVQVEPGSDATTLRLADGTQIIIQEGLSEEPDGSAYKALRFGFEVTPLVTGRIEIPPASASMRLKTGRYRVVRDFFFEKQVPEVIEYSAQSPAIEYVVRELPLEGRPQGFTGAVGRYKISATASPTEVDAFAPITLEIRVRGEGLIEELKPPAWHEMDALTKDFDVSSDIDTGKLEGDAKVFRQVIRARSDKVTEIPLVPFPYYDPALSRYEVAFSDPIPIKVRPAKTATIEPSVPASAPERAGKILAQPSAERISRRFGIRENFRTIGNVRRALDPRELFFEIPFLATLFGAPVACGLFALALRLLERDPRERERARTLARARRELSSGGSDFERICAAYQDYLRARFDLPPGEITRRELSERLEASGVPQEVREAVVAALDEMLDVRFSGGDAKPGLRERALAAVRQVDRCKLR